MLLICSFKDLSSNPSDDNEESSVMSIPVPLAFSKAHSSKKQNTSDHSLNNDQLFSATNMTRSPSLSLSSDDQQDINSRSPSESSVSTALSSNSTISDSSQQELSTAGSASSPSNDLSDSSAKSDQDIQHNR